MSGHASLQVLNIKDGTTLSAVQYHEGFLGQRIGPVSALHWHRNEPLLAAGGADSIVSVYNCSAGLGLG